MEGLPIIAGVVNSEDKHIQFPPGESKELLFPGAGLELEVKILPSQPLYFLLGEGREFENGISRRPISD